MPENYFAWSKVFVKYATFWLHLFCSSTKYGVTHVISKALLLPVWQSGIWLALSDMTIYPAHLCGCPISWYVCILLVVFIFFFTFLNVFLLHTYPIIVNKVVLYTTSVAGVLTLSDSSMHIGSMWSCARNLNSTFTFHSRGLNVLHIKTYLYYIYYAYTYTHPKHTHNKQSINQ